MKIIYLLLLLCSGVFSGCEKETPNNRVLIDPPGFSHFVWKNHSDHRITISLKYAFDPTIIEPQTRLIVEARGGIMSCTPPRDYTERGLTIVFDDGPYGGTFSRNIPQSELDQRFDLSQNENYHEWFTYTEEGAPLMIYTYTFTNADYAAAVLRGPMPEPEPDQEPEQ